MDEGSVILAKAAPAVREIDQLNKLTARRGNMKPIYGIVIYALVIYAFVHFLPKLTNAPSDPAPPLLPFGSIPPVTSVWFWFGVLCVLVVIGCGVYWFNDITRKQRTTYARMMKPFELLFTDLRVEARNEMGSSNFKWTAFTRHKTDPSGITVLFIDQATAVWWSKAWFASTSDYDHVMDHVRRLNLAHPAKLS